MGRKREALSGLSLSSFCPGGPERDVSAGSSRAPRDSGAACWAGNGFQSTAGLHQKPSRFHLAVGLALSHGQAAEVDGRLPRVPEADALAPSAESC